MLESAYREAPGLTLSAGTSQIMLDLIASSALERPETADDPVLERLSRSIRGALDGGADPRGALTELGAFAFEAPIEADGFELGLGTGVAVAIELGRKALPDLYGPAALAIAVAVDADDLKTAEQIGAGEDFDDVSGTLSADLLAAARTRHAGYLFGLASGAYERAVAHALSRRQFGRALVENQAIAFGLAQARVRLFALHRLVERAVEAVEDPAADGDLAAVEAAAYAVEAAMDVVRFAVQVHGARGLSLQEPVHAYYPAVRLAASRFGPVRSLWCEAGRRRLDAV